jgi:hypothetical protein
MTSPSSLGGSIVFVTGDRDWTDRQSLREVFQCHLPSTWFLAGGCRGADLIAEQEAEIAGLLPIRMAAPWSFYKKRAGPIRNRAMGKLLAALRASGFTVTAYVAHDNLAASRGTADMVRVLEGHGFEWTPIHSGGRKSERSRSTKVENLNQNPNQAEIAGWG